MTHFYQPFDLWEALERNSPAHFAFVPQFPRRHGHEARKGPACNKSQGAETGRQCPFVSPETNTPKPEASSSKEAPKEKKPSRESHPNPNPWPKAFENPDLNPILEAFTSQLGLSDLLNSLSPDSKASHKETDFTPRADIFNAPTKYVIHISLPGAQKDDISLDYDYEKSTLDVAGVVYRPGLTEPLADALLVDGRAREVGVFEKSVRLDTATGARGPVPVDEAKISAKLADGVLVVELPKLDGGEEKKPRRIEVEQVREKGQEKGKEVVGPRGDELVNVDEAEVEGGKGYHSPSVEEAGDDREYITVDAQ